MKNLFFWKESISDRKNPLSGCLHYHNLSLRILKYCGKALINFLKNNAKDRQVHDSNAWIGVNQSFTHIILHDTVVTWNMRAFEYRMYTRKDCNNCCEGIIGRFPPFSQISFILNLQWTAISEVNFNNSKKHPRP